MKKAAKREHNSIPWGPIQTACNNGLSIEQMATKFDRIGTDAKDRFKPMRAILAIGRKNGKLTKNAGLQRGPGVSKATKAVKAKKVKTVGKKAPKVVAKKTPKKVVLKKGKVVASTNQPVGPAYVSVLTEEGEHVLVTVTQNKMLLGLQDYVDAVEPTFLAAKGAIEAKRLAEEAKAAANATPVDTKPEEAAEPVTEEAAA